MSIPASIIQSHESEYGLPATFAKCRDRIEELCPGFDYQFFNADGRRSFVAERRPDLLCLYDFYPRNIQRADLFRVIYMYECGGIYLDMDLYLHTSLDGILSHDLVLAEEWKMPEDEFFQRHHVFPGDNHDLIQYGNYAFAAEAGSWFFSEVLREIAARAAAIDVAHCWSDDVFFSTGPDVFSTVARRNKSRLFASAHVLRGGPKGRWCQFGEYGTHLMTGVWQGSAPIERNVLR